MFFTAAIYNVMPGETSPSPMVLGSSGNSSGCVDDGGHLDDSRVQTNHHGQNGIELGRYPEGVRLISASVSTLIVWIG